MKIEFLKSRPKIQVVLNRDSVCAGDDCVSHEKTVEVYALVDPQAFVKEVSSGYLPAVAGVGHGWTCVLNGVKIAEIGSFGIRALVRECPFAEENRVGLSGSAVLTLSSILSMRSSISKRGRNIAYRVALAIMAAYCIGYLILTLGGEYRGPVSSGRSQLFAWGWGALDVYIWQPKFLMLKRNNYNVGGLIFSPLILVDRLVWHKDKPG